jgi:hypothetical protein
MHLAVLLLTFFASSYPAYLAVLSRAWIVHARAGQLVDLLTSPDLDLTVPFSPTQVAKLWVTLSLDRDSGPIEKTLRALSVLTGREAGIDLRHRERS